MKNISRREALRWIGAGLVTISLPSLWSCAHRALVKEEAAAGFAFPAISPIDRAYVRPATSYSGDNPDRAHKILWNKDQYLADAGGIPEVTEEAQVVIVGGGMSGIISAYLLRDLKPVLLERAERFGGNARGESWQGVDYSIGAAYFTSAAEGTAVHKLFSEAGVYQHTTVKKEQDPILFGGKLYKDFFAGDTDPAARQQFVKAAALFSDFGNSENGRIYPVIPPTTEAEAESVKSLDRYSFLEFMEKELGRLHPHLRSLLEDYCWSGMGSSMKETSAALGIFFFSGEFADVLVTPGGNAKVAEVFLQHLHAAEPAGLRPSSVVLDVEVKGNASFVTYEDAGGKLRRIKAGAVVMACPKFVAGKLIRNLEPSRLRALGKMKYQPYLVANALLNTPVKNGNYDIFLIGDGKFSSENVRAAATARGATDVVLGNFASFEKNRTVLTLYRPLPYSDARGEIFAPESFERFQQEFRAQLEKEILPALGYAGTDLAEIRIARWGHPMPTAAPGIYRGDTLAKLRKPFKERVFFVQQDNWACPAIETCAREALAWAPKVREALIGSRAG